MREENKRRTAVFILESSLEIKEQKIVSETQEKKNKKQSKFLELGRLHEIDHFQREMNRFMPKYF